jgi:hypothetical protein
MQTTLNKIWKCSPESDDWAKILKSVNKTQADDEPIEFSHIVETQWLSDAIWYLRTVDGIEPSIVSFISFCQRQCTERGLECEEFDLTDNSPSNLSDIAYEAQYDAIFVNEISIDEKMFHNSATYDRARNKTGDKISAEQKQKFIELFC